MAAERYLTTAEAAKRLGVKPETLYAYVSRGRVASQRGADGRSSVFALEDVERLAGRSRMEPGSGLRLATITTSVTRLGRSGPSYRGHDAATLATAATYESAAELLWAAGTTSPTTTWRKVRPSIPKAPRGASYADTVRLAVLADAVECPGRYDRRPESIVRNARRVISAAASSLPDRATRRVPLELEGVGVVEGTLAEELSARLAARVDGPELVRSVNAAMVLLADHELSAGALAARVAASTRADLSNALLAGLGALSGPYHAGASALAHDLLARADERGAEESIEQALRWQDSLPGFGHPIYDEGDPRSRALVPLVERFAPAGRRRTVEAVRAGAERRQLPPPNIDFALASLSFCAGMPPEAGETIFSVARLAGLVAHFLEEIAEKPLRFRVRAVYSAAPAAGHGGLR